MEILLVIGLTAAGLVIGILGGLWKAAPPGVALGMFGIGLLLTLVFVTIALIDSSAPPEIAVGTLLAAWGLASMYRRSRDKRRDARLVS